MGFQSSTISAPRGGGIDTLLNEYSQRSTATYVSFGPMQRELGEGGRLKAVTNGKNTVSFFKHLLGRQFKDADVQATLALGKYRPVEMEDGTVGFTCAVQGEDQVFSVVQITGMLLGQLRRTAIPELGGGKVSDCVIGVPCGFTDAQRNAMLAASKIAGLNCLKLINETTATALAYGIYKQDLPAVDEKPRRVVFANCGHSLFQLCVADFVKGKLTVRATASSAVGGRDFDRVLFEHIADEFKGKYKIDVRANARASVRLEQECEKLKKLMSANKTPVKLNIECFMEDKDVTASVDRALLEELSAAHLAKIEETCNQLVTNLTKELGEKKPKLEDIDFVEICGGAVRIPAIKAIMAKVFDTDLKTTLNLDEAVSRGCALQAAISSPTFRVRDFAVTDKTVYGIGLNWKATDGEENDAELYTDNGTAGLTKVLTFYRDADFGIDAVYTTPAAIPGAVASIGTFTLKGVTPGFDGKSQKIKASFKLDDHGIFKMTDAHMVEKLPPAPEPEAAPEAEIAEAAVGGDEAKADEPAKDAPEEKKKTLSEPASKKAKTTKNTPLEIVTASASAYDDAALNKFIESENQLADLDRAVREKSDAKNALEEYIYSMRDQISSNLEEFLPEAEREEYSKKLTAYEDWLYDEGDDVEKSAYVAKFNELVAVGAPVKARYTEWEARKPAMEALNAAIFTVRKFLGDKVSGDEKYAHLSDDEIAKVQKQFEVAEKNCNEWVPKCAAYKKTDTPVILAAQFTTEVSALERVYLPIMNRPAPVVEPPAVVPEEVNEAAGKGYGEGDAAPAADAEKTAEAPAADAPADAASSMEVD